MKFTTPSLVEQVLWDMRIADLPRGTNRAQIDSLFNGNPPWTLAEQTTARIRTNVNWLEAPKLAADARRTYMNAFMKASRFFTVTCDYGPVHRRGFYGQIITKEINRILKRSMPYFELLRSQFAATVLHGIGPALWSDSEKWCPEPVGIEDIMIPSGTYLTMQNLDYFGIFRQYTAAELHRKLNGPKRDPGWNMKVAKAALDWVNKQDQATHGYSELFAPEKVEDRYKEDLGYYGTDAVPTVDCWDFYYWEDDGKKAGWRRCMVLDTPLSDEIGTVGNGKSRSMPDKNLIGGKHGEWLFDGRDRIWADQMSEIIHFQFGDCSAKAPFKYHTVRSIGWLLYAVCHLQNRLRCKVNDAVFESLLQYFRVSNPDDHERITKIELQNYGVIPDGVDFVKQGDRWKVDAALVGSALQQNRSMMVETAAQFREGRDQQQAGIEKTATQIMAEVNSANALVGSMLLQAYMYQLPQFNEIMRRYCIRNSKDPEVRRFQQRVLSKNVPEKALDPECLFVEPEKVLGHGNKTLEIAMADKLMAVRHLHSPEGQQEILRIYDSANSDNPEMADRLVPQMPRPSSTLHDAQLMFGTLMEGVPVTPTPGQNAGEAANVLIAMAATLMASRVKMQVPPNVRDLVGLQTVLGAIGQYMRLFAQDKQAAAAVKETGQKFSQLQQAVAMYAKELAQQQPQQQQAAPDPKDAAKAQAMVIQAQTKAQIQAGSHAQRTQERNVQFQQKLQQQAQQHDLEMKKKLAEQQVDTAAKDIETAAEIQRQQTKAENEPTDNE